MMANYIVAPDDEDIPGLGRRGNDLKGDGTIEKPWATIAHAVEMVEGTDYKIINFGVPSYMRKLSRREAKRMHHRKILNFLWAMIFLIIGALAFILLWGSMTGALTIGG